MGDLSPIYGALAPDPNATYGQILPFARDNTTGATRWAMPDAVRSGLKGYLDLANSTQTGSLTGDALSSLTFGSLGGGGMLAPRGAIAAGGGAARLSPRYNPNMSKTINTLGEVQALTGEPLFARWSRGPKYDMKPSAKSFNQVTRQNEAGLSATHIADDLDPYLMARRLAEYEFLKAEHPDNQLHLYRGKEIGRGGDNEPLIVPTEHVGTVSPELTKAVGSDTNVQRMTLENYIKDNEAFLARTEPTSVHYAYPARELARYRQELADLGGPVTDPILKYSMAAPAPFSLAGPSPTPSPMPNSMLPPDQKVY